MKHERDPISKCIVGVVSRYRSIVAVEYRSRCIQPLDFEQDM